MVWRPGPTGRDRAIPNSSPWPMILGRPMERSPDGSSIRYRKGPITRNRSRRQLHAKVGMHLPPGCGGTPFKISNREAQDTPCVALHLSLFFELVLLKGVATATPFPF